MNPTLSVGLGMLVMVFVISLMGMCKLIKKTPDDWPWNFIMPVLFAGGVAITLIGAVIS